MLKRSIAFLVVLTAPIAAQEPHVALRDAGPGEPGAILREALGRPYIVRREQWNTRLFRDSVFDRSVIILGSDASVASTVHGDVIVVGGDLFLRPGAAIDGRAIAYGGGVYDSQLATVRGERLSFRDTRFDIVQSGDTVTLDYRPLAGLEGPPIVSLPLLYGLRVPSYTRVDGLGLPWGPRLTLGEGRYVLDPTVTYRSDLGTIDPALTMTLQLDQDSTWTAEIFGGRGTVTNDGWIESDAVNSLKVLVDGRDYRNYWRADRIRGRVIRTWRTESGELGLWAGAQTEHDRSVAAGGPWSLRGETVGDGIIRPNPAVERGLISSALVGASGTLALDHLTMTGALVLERPFETPRDERFTQATIDAGIQVPTVGTQTFEVRAHALLTAGDQAPPQRFTYIGGSGTLPTFSVLQFGGDHVLFVESAYNVPIEALGAPLIGSPVISLRYATGAAGVGKLPSSFEQNLMVRLALSLAYVEYAVDPSNGRDEVSLGITTPLIR